MNFRLKNCPIKKNPWNPYDDNFWKKDGTARGSYKDYPKSVEKLFNEINESMKAYILGTSKDDKW